MGISEMRFCEYAIFRELHSMSRTNWVNLHRLLTYELEAVRLTYVSGMDETREPNVLGTQCWACGPEKGPYQSWSRYDP